jgi:hypothetical protein
MALRTPEEVMSEATQRWSDELKDSFDLLKTMKDELKVQVHLAGMEAKERFAALEKRLDSEQLTARKNAHALVADFKVLKEELGRQSKP